MQCRFQRKKTRAILARMNRQILYAGDTSLSAAASYLAGIMHHDAIQFNYLASDQPFDISLLGGECRALVLSDYPSRNFAPGQVEMVARRVEGGLGLLMIGGWESYTGVGGDYGKTALREVLPVGMLEEDDRVNCAQPCLMEMKCAHPVIQDLPFDQVTPSIGGYNRVTLKPEGREILVARRIRISRNGSGFAFSPLESADPLLVTRTFGKGRVTAFMSDVAPHWVGGLVDWGDRRVTARAPGAGEVEVGNWYAQFFCRMIRWTAAI